MNFRIFFYCCKEWHWEFDRVELNLVQFGLYGHFNNVNSSNAWTENAFLYINAFLHFLHQRLYNFGYKSFTSLVKSVFLSIFFVVTIANGIVFPVHFQIVCCLYIETPLNIVYWFYILYIFIFVYWFCILQFGSDCKTEDLIKSGFLNSMSIISLFFFFLS